MDILLVTPWSKKKFNLIIIPNVGLGYLASALRKEGHRVTILDCAKDRVDSCSFKEYITKRCFDVVGFSMFTGFFSAVREYAAVAKQMNPDIYTIAGGPHPTLEPIETMELLTDIDFAFQGEAEKGLPGLIRELAERNGAINKEALARINGLLWRVDKHRVICNPRTLIENLDELEYPAWDLIKPQQYPLAPIGVFSKKKKIAPIVASRGCPHLCTFCAACNMSGGKTRFRSAGNIIGEIKLLKKGFGIEEIHIIDDNFTESKTLVKDFCRGLLKEKLNICWSCPNGVRLDTLDEELLGLMEEAGCYSLGLGIEFGSQRILDSVKKNLRLELAGEKVNLIKKTTKIRTTGFFILGHPEEEAQDVEKTINLACGLNIDRANFFNFIPFPGNEIYRDLKKNGQLNNISYDDLYINNIVFHPEKIPLSRLRNLQKKAFMRFYFRPKILFGLIGEIKSLSQIKVILRKIFRIIFNR